MKCFFKIIFICLFFCGLELTADEREPCAFCSEQVLERQVFYQDDLISVLYDHKPVFEGHCLLIPNRHVERYEDLTAEERARIAEITLKVDRVIRRVFKTSAYLITQKNGKEVGQAVPHVHMHYIPRKAGEDSMVKLCFNLFTASLFSALSDEEMQESVANLRIEMAKEINE